MELFNDKIYQHYLHPQHVGTLDNDDPDVGTGSIGSYGASDVMRLQIKVDDQQNIIDAKYKVHGSGAAIACCSYATARIIGKSLINAGQLTSQQIAAALDLPPARMHCAMAAEDVIKAAIKDYVTHHECAGC